MQISAPTSALTRSRAPSRWRSLCDATTVDMAARALLRLLADAGAPSPTRVESEAQLALLATSAATAITADTSAADAVSSASAASAASAPPMPTSTAAPPPRTPTPPSPATPAAPAYGASTAPITPLFIVSATTGRGLPLLKRSLWRLRSRDWGGKRAASTLVTVDRCHPPSSDLVLQEDDPWSSTPTQELLCGCRNRPICNVLVSWPRLRQARLRVRPRCLYHSCDHRSCRSPTALS